MLMSRIDIYMSGAFTLHTVDNLLIVHNTDSKVGVLNLVSILIYWTVL
jgi:hypothetical protein